VPETKIVYSDYGMRLFEPAPAERSRGPVRFGYIGALHPQKGIELLIESFRDIGGNATLDVFGSAFASPISDSYLQRIRERAAPEATFHGAYDNGDVAAILARFDMLIVPSLWYENSPLTIHEAFMAGTPVITADEGGMAELVRDGISGLHFRLGDAADLRNKIRSVVEDPDSVTRLREGIPHVKSIEEDAAQTLDRYRDVAATTR